MCLVLSFNASSQVYSTPQGLIVDNDTTLTADFENRLSDVVIQIDLNDAASATVNLNNLTIGILYAVHLYNATNTLVTFASNESETYFRYSDGTVISSSQHTIAEGELIPFYFFNSDIWTNIDP